MGEWYGYEQHPGAHPERPWWRVFGPMATRTDGRTAIAVPDLSVEMSLEQVAEAGVLALADVIAKIDAEHPLPPPAPLCGQVWRMESGTCFQVVVVCDGRGLFMNATGVYGTPEWPPSDTVLVAGPGSPWAPADYEPPKET